MLRRTRIIDPNKLWDVFQKFVNKGMSISQTERTLGLGSGYIRSVKSKRRLPKYDTYKKISDYLRETQRIGAEQYKGIIQNDDMVSILDALYIRYELEKRKLSIADLARFMQRNEHTVAERLRYWRDKDTVNMTLDTVYEFEHALRDWDKNKSMEVDDSKDKKLWDFNKERNHFLRTGELILD